MLQLVDRLDHEVRPRHRPRAATSSLSPIPISSTCAGSHATTTTLPGHAPSVLTKRSTVCGSMRVRVDHLPVLDARLDVLLVRLHHVERPGLAALAAHVYQHERVVAAHHLVGEVEAAGAEVEHDRALAGARAPRGA